MYVITGASDGLGLALAMLLVTQGKKVACLSRTAPPDARILHITCDLTNEASIKKAAAEILKISQPLVALINCAGVFSEQPLGEVTGSEVARTFTTNVIGPIILVSALMERIKKDGADVVNISSTAGTQGNAYQASYGSSKWAMRGFSQTLQTELKATSCRVISFVPGGMHTEMFNKYDTKQAPDNKKWMEPTDVARFILQILELPKNIEVSEVIVKRRSL